MHQQFSARHEIPELRNITHLSSQWKIFSWTYITLHTNYSTKTWSKLAKNKKVGVLILLQESHILIDWGTLTCMYILYRLPVSKCWHLLLISTYFMWHTFTPVTLSNGHYYCSPTWGPGILCQHPCYWGTECHSVSNIAWWLPTYPVRHLQCTAAWLGDCKPALLGEWTLVKVHYWVNNSVFTHQENR
jgi:hypothetical protein